MTFFKQFKSLWGAVAIAAAAGPLGMIAPNLHPPWPTGSASVAMIVSGCSLILAYARIKSKKPVLKIESIGLILVGVALLLTYLTMFSMFILEETQQTAAGENVLRFVIGYEYLPEILELEADDTDIDLLRNVLYQVDQVWTLKSITTVRIAMMICFSVSFATIAYGSTMLSKNNQSVTSE